MAKIKIDYSKPLVHRDGYEESKQIYANDTRRVDNFQLGGGRKPDTGNSGSRLVMSNKFGEGEMTILNPTPKSQLGGMENSFLKGDFGAFVAGEGDQIVLDVLMNNDSFDDHYMVVHTNAIKRGRISVTRIPKMMKHHASYGFDIIPIEGFHQKIQPGSVLRQEERLAHTRSTLPNNMGYGYGREVNVVFASSFSTNEDTCAVLDTELLNYQTVSVEEYSVYVNNENIPLNEHGTEEVYRAIPEVGEIIADGRLMSLRRRKRDRYLVHRTKKSMRAGRDPVDEVLYCKRGGEVVSVDVQRANTKKIMNKYLPSRLVSSLDSKAAKRLNIYEQILELERKYKRNFGAAYSEDVTWNMLVREAISSLVGPRLKPFYPYYNKKLRTKEVTASVQETPITGYLITIKVRSIIKPHLGYKFCDNHGAKYTISEIRTKERMFKDKWGRVCHFLTNGVANINRAIWGRLAEPYRGDALWHLRRNLRLKLDSEGEEAAIEYYRRGIEVISEKTHWMLSQLTDEQLVEHYREVLYGDNYLQVEDEAGDRAVTIDGTHRIYTSEFNPPIDKLTFTDYRGIERQTVNPIAIGVMYVSMNEKMGSECSACNIPMRQYSGQSRKITSDDKKRTQVSNQSTRAYSDADWRAINDALPADQARHVFREGTSQAAIREMFGKFLDGDAVADIDMDNKDSRGIEIFKSELAVDGVELTNRPRSERWDKK